MAVLTDHGVALQIRMITLLCTVCTRSISWWRSIWEMAQVETDILDNTRTMSARGQDTYSKFEQRKRSSFCKFQTFAQSFITGVICSQWLAPLLQLRVEEPDHSQTYCLIYRPCIWKHMVCCSSHVLRKTFMYVKLSLQVRLKVYWRWFWIAKHGALCFAAAVGVTNTLINFVSKNSLLSEVHHKQFLKTVYCNFTLDDMNRKEPRIHDNSC